mmetsp:Transcript_77207/g.221936  ORF Transcript_77207/g.221936 Transcript_77207/m.221936 type:complete len:202 (+) Transcript_77207:976-1581(+)
MPPLLPIPSTPHLPQALKAFGAIDEMVDENKLNSQILAAVPAFMLVYLTSRVGFSVVFFFRSRKISDSRTVYSRCTEYLADMERLLITGHGDATAITAPTKDAVVDANASLVSAGAGQWTTGFVGVDAMGELILLMHKFTTLLEKAYFHVPLLSSRHAAQDNRRFLRRLLAQGELSTTQQLQMLQIAATKHRELVSGMWTA